CINKPFCCIAIGGGQTGCNGHIGGVPGTRWFGHSGVIVGGKVGDNRGNAESSGCESVDSDVEGSGIILGLGGDLAGRRNTTVLSTTGAVIGVEGGEGTGDGGGEDSCECEELSGNMPAVVDL
ncbi:hypothetical protein Ocin01_05352, partial [Orchesella cincta]